MDAVKRALDLSKAVKTRFIAGRVYASLGEAAKARELSASLASEVQVEPQVYGKLVEGETALSGGDSKGAIKLVTEANGMLDAWMGRLDLRRGSVERGAGARAASVFRR